MGKVKLAEKKENDAPLAEGEVKPVAKASSKVRVSNGILYVQATFNNTKVLFTDSKGNALISSSSGALGFTGAKKGTPFAAAKVGELVGDKAKLMGVKEADVIVKGVGAGRESAIRAFSSKGIIINAIADMTPIPHNGPRPKKPRRV